MVINVVSGYSIVKFLLVINMNIMLINKVININTITTCIANNVVETQDSSS